MNRRNFLWSLAAIFLGLLGIASYFLLTFEEPAVDPAWALRGGGQIPGGSVTVRYTGTSTLLFSDGETDWIVDGWFSRFGPLEILGRPIAPDLDAITRGLKHNQIENLAMVIPIHSHFDHAMDSPEVAKRTGAILLGSESTANIARGWGLAEDRIRIATNRQPVQVEKFTITLIETRHFEFPDPEIAERALSNPDITEPLVPPVDAFEYRVGQPYAIHVSPPRGRWLIQGSAGYTEGGFSGYDAHVVFLGIGGLGLQTEAYREAYWHQTVTAVGATRVIPIHWDSLTSPAEGPLTGPLRAVGALVNGGGRGPVTLAFLKQMEKEHPEFHFSTLPRFDEIVLFE